MPAIHRTFTPDSVIALPRMGTAEAMALGTALDQSAENVGELPTPIAKARQKLQEQLADLGSRIVNRSQEGGDGRKRQQFNRALDNSWAAGYHWTRAWMRLPYPTHANLVAAATRINEILFSEGIRFTTYEFRRQWAKSKSLLDLINENGLEAQFAELGGQEILDSIRQAHLDFGNALNITEVTEAVETDLRSGVNRLRDSMRRYVLVVAAHADPDEPATEALANQLLMPVTTWKDRTIQNSADNVDSENDNDSSSELPDSGDGDDTDGSGDDTDGSGDDTDGSGNDTDSGTDIDSDDNADVAQRRDARVA